MRHLAAWGALLGGVPPYGFNVYVMGGVLVDAATRFAAGGSCDSSGGGSSGPRAHPRASRSQGSSHAVCETLGLPLWCGEGDAPAMETEGLIMARMPPHWLSRAVGPRWTGPPHPVARRLREGDEVGGFHVLETPGHTIGHIAFWREHDGSWSLGDVMANMNIWTGMPMLREPERIFSLDPAMNRRSAARLAELEPRLVCFGHGPPSGTRISARGSSPASTGPA